MHTITPHVTQAAILALRHFGAVRPVASASQVSRALAEVAVCAVIAVLIFVTAMLRAARRFAALIAEFVQLAATMTSYMFTTIVTVVLVAVVLLHH